MKDGLKILLVTIGLIIGLETIFQIVHFFNSNNNFSNENETAFRFNENYLVELVPNANKLFVRTQENGSDSIYWNVNSDGFRGKKIQSNPDTRIMVYGDSNIQARFSVEESTFVHKTKKYLSKKNTQSTEVINAGIVGFGPDQSLLKFEEEVTIYNPDLVIFTIFAYNDLGDIIRNRLFNLIDNETIIKTTFPIEEDEFLTKKESGFKFQIPLWTDGIRTNFFSKSDDPNSDEFKEDVLNYHIDSNERAFRIYKKGEKREFSNFEDPFDIDIAISPNSESSITKKKLFKSVLARLKETSENNNVELIVLILPSAIDMTISNDLFGYNYLNERFPSYNKKSFSDSLEKLSKELGLNTINLYTLFDQNNPENLYFKEGDTHWNDSGQDLAAKLTASFISDSLWKE